MNVKFLDHQDRGNPLNEVTFGESGAIIAALESLQFRPAFLCELFGNNEQNLLLGIGGQIGCCQYSSNDGNPPYLMAVDDLQAERGDFTEFLTADTPTPIAQRYCISFGNLLKIVEYFVLTGERWPGITWEEVTPY